MTPTGDVLLESARLRCRPCASSSPARAARSARPPSTPSTRPATRSPPATSAAPVFEAAGPDAPALQSGRPHRRRRRLRRRPRPRRGDPRRRAARADAATRPHTVFQNNLMSVFNTLEAAVRFGVPRYVNVSSETVPGFFFPERPFLPDYAPVDEEHPIRPQDPYATAKYFSELLMDAAMRRSDIRCLTIRPSWVQWEGNYAHNLGAALRDPEAEPSAVAVGLHRRLRPRRRPGARRRVRPRHPRGLLHRLARQPRQPAARRARPPPPRRRDRDARAPPPPRRLGPQHRQGPAAARLRAQPLLARLPHRGRRAARRRPRAARARATPASSAAARWADSHPQRVSAQP